MEKKEEEKEMQMDVMKMPIMHEPMPADYASWMKAKR